MIRWNTITVHACVASAIIAFPLLAQKQDKQAAANACSMMDFSMCLIVTGG